MTDPEPILDALRRCRTVEQVNATLDLLWEVAMDAKIWAEDAIELEKNGYPHGFKPGRVEAKRRLAERAIKEIDAIRSSAGLLK